MLEVHLVERPAWIDALVNVVMESMTPLGFIGPLGYRWWEPGNPNNDHDGWQLFVFPTPNELRGGPHDGCRYVAGFEIDALALMSVFHDVQAVAWKAPVQYNGDLDGPELIVQGLFAGKNVKLRVVSFPPRDEPASYTIVHETGEAVERPT